MRLRSFDDYVKHDKFKLLKIHGCVNWGRVYTNLQGQSIKSGNGQKYNFDRGTWQSSYQVLKELTGMQRSTKPVAIYDNLITGGEQDLLYPALAIPMGGKENPVCPPPHIDEAKKFLKHCKKFLFIGYRANDETVLDLLRSRGNIQIEKLYAVLRSKKSVEEFKTNLARVNDTFRQFQNSQSQNFQFIENTFANFVHGEKFSNLLSP